MPTDKSDWNFCKVWGMMMWLNETKICSKRRGERQMLKPIKDIMKARAYKDLTYIDKIRVQINYLKYRVKAYGYTRLLKIVEFLNI